MPEDLKFLRTTFLENTLIGSFWKYLMNSLFIVYENDEWCHFGVRVGSAAIISFYLRVFGFFLFLFFSSYYFRGFYYLLMYWSKSVNTLKRSSGVVLRFLTGASSGELLQLYLVINVTRLDQFWKKILSYISPPLAWNTNISISVSH